MANFLVKYIFLNITYMIIDYMAINIFITIIRTKNYFYRRWNLFILLFTIH